MSTGIEWFYIVGSERVGPVSENEIINLIAAGVISRETFVWKESMEDWSEAYLSDLAKHFKVEAPEEHHGLRKEFDGVWQSIKDFLNSEGDLKKKFEVWFRIYIVSEIAAVFLMVFGPLGILGFISASFFSALILYHSWKLLPRSSAPTSPLAMVLLLLVPLFNFYWNFVCYYGLTKAINHQLESEGGDEEKVNENLALVYCICVVVFALSFVFSFVLLLGKFTSIIMFVMHLVLLKSIIKGSVKLIK